MLNQIDMFRQYGLGSFQELLRQLARDPAMIFWLDNNFNHKDAINENWGRELLELFSMGVGMDGQPNYTEDDVQEAARSFTGWTIDDDNVASIPYGKTPWLFRYDQEDHDAGTKIFLGETGNFDGDDIIEIICRQPSTARFISRHLYNFFVADDVQVPAWQSTPPPDPEAIAVLESEYFRSGYDIRSMLRVMFTSEFFKSESARFARVKSPAEVVVGTLHLVGRFQIPPGRFHGHGSGVPLHEPGPAEFRRRWKAGIPAENGSTAAAWWSASTTWPIIWGDATHPGVRAIVTKLADRNPDASEIVDGCLDLLGNVILREDNRNALVAQAEAAMDAGAGVEEVVLNALRMIGSTREYQFA